MNRILFSNTKMVLTGFPKAKAQQFKLAFKYRTYENGKIIDQKRKYFYNIVDWPMPFLRKRVS